MTETPIEDFQARIAALTSDLAGAEARAAETDRLLTHANAELSRMTSRRDVFRELATAHESELTILRAECSALRTQLETRDDQLLECEREMEAAIAQVQRLSRAREAFALALHERERIDGERLQFANDEIRRLRKTTPVVTLNDSAMQIALMERSWAEEIPEDRSAV